MATVAAAAGISRRTLYRLFTASALIDACERRAMTIWRARFERRIHSAKVDAVGRLFLVADDIADWVVSERFHADQVLRPASVEDPRGGALSEHMEALRTFGIGLAQEAHVEEPERFGHWLALNVAGVAAWVNRRQEAHSLAIGNIENLTGTSRLR
jgi:AcrR family transcriptional regulator